MEKLSNISSFSYILPMVKLGDISDFQLNTPNGTHIIKSTSNNFGCIPAIFLTSWYLRNWVDVETLTIWNLRFQLYTASGAHVNGLTSHMELPPEHAGVPLAMASSAGPPSASRPGALPVYQQSYSVPSSPNPGTLSPASVSSSGSSAAASFFAR